MRQEFVQVLSYLDLIRVKLQIVGIGIPKTIRLGRFSSNILLQKNHKFVYE